jgi:predicted RNA-binding protein with PUA-like domain
MAKPATAPPQALTRQYWLFKSEPSVFSIQHLAAAKDQTYFWDGVRNYQVRNYLRDTIQLGDRVLFYHSNADPIAVVGTAEVVKTGYPDHTAFDPKHHYFDPKSKRETPTWYMVDVRLLQQFPHPITRDQLRETPATSTMQVMKRGMRLSIQQVTPDEWQAVHKLAGVCDLP